MDFNQELLKKLLSYRGNKEFYKELNQKYPKNFIQGTIDDIFDFIEYLKEKIIIDGKKIYEIEPDNWEMYLLMYIYFGASRDTMFQIALSSNNFQNLISTIENQLELIANIVKNREQIEKIVNEVEEEKKATTSNSQ
jgi:hypothetical protein